MRSNPSVSEGRGLSNKDILFASSIAQQSSAANMENDNNNIDRKMK